MLYVVVVVNCLRVYWRLGDASGTQPPPEAAATLGLSTSLLSTIYCIPQTSTITRSLLPNL
jgi:hypothetical protein